MQYLAYARALLSIPWLVLIFATQWEIFPRDFTHQQSEVYLKELFWVQQGLWYLNEVLITFLFSVATASHFAQYYLILLDNMFSLGALAIYYVFEIVHCVTLSGPARLAADIINIGIMIMMSRRGFVTGQKANSQKYSSILRLFCLTPFFFSLGFWSFMLLRDIDVFYEVDAGGMIALVVIISVGLIVLSLTFNDVTNGIIFIALLIYPLISQSNTPFGYTCFTIMCLWAFTALCCAIVSFRRTYWKWTSFIDGAYY